MQPYNTHPEECPGGTEEWKIAFERDNDLRFTEITRKRHKHKDEHGPCRHEWMVVEIPDTMARDPRFYEYFKSRGFFL